jgi:filamentous hemagglutinin family protein
MDRVRTITNSIFTAGAAALLVSTASAGVVTDGTVGPGRQLVGPDYHIPESLGSRVGANLFHSFQTFGLQTRDGVSESATFTGSDDIAHVISRVTGGQASIIDGLLFSEIANADFFFFNPAGVAIGPNAWVDVPAAFHVSTADELRLADGSLFSAAHPEQSTLGMAPPEAFGYLGAQSASLVVNGSSLQFRPGSRITLSGGDLTVQSAQIASEAGSLALIGQGTAAGAATIEGDAVDARGGLRVTDSAFDLQGDGGGRMVVRAGIGEFANSEFLLTNLGDKDAGRALQVTAQELNLRQGSYWDASTRSGSGRAGSIRLDTTDRLILQDGSWIGNGSWSNGHAGDIDIFGNDFLMTGDRTGIGSGAEYGSTGRGGSVRVDMDGLIEILDGARVLNGTNAMGDAGDVTLHAGRLHLDRRGSASLTGILSRSEAGAEGDAGDVTVVVDGLLEVVGGASISSSTFSTGDAGNLDIRAGSAWLNRDGAESFTGFASQANAGSRGNGGSVKVSVANAMHILNGATVNSSTYSAGNAGDVTVTADLLTLDAQHYDLWLTGVISRAHTTSTGQAGNIAIQARHLQVRNGALITVGQYGASAGMSQGSERRKISIGSSGKRVHPEKASVKVADTKDSSYVV